MSEDKKRLYSVKDAIEYLSISKATLYNLINDNQLLPIKIGKSTRFDKIDLDLFIDKKK